MRRNFAIIGIVLLFGFAACQSETTTVEESTTVQQPLATGPETPPPPVPSAFDTTGTVMTDTTVQTATDTTATTTAVKASALPKTHTVDHGGSMHAAGAADNPTQKCGACHGRDLKGGKTGPSCFDCHEQKW